MPKQIVPLNDLKVRNAKAGPAPVKLFDGGGLFLHVAPTGKKTWRWKYRHQGKERLIVLGGYPSMGLAEAREAAAKQRRILGSRRDPVAVRIRGEGGQDTFATVAAEWYRKTSPAWAESHAATVTERLDRDILPWLGPLPVDAIKPADVLACLRRVESRGAAETARRERQMIGQIFRYGVASARCENDPSAALVGALEKPSVRHFPAITDEAELGCMLRAMWTYPGSLPVQIALRLTPMLLLRPGELRKLEWAWVKFDKALVELPGEIMKNGQPHLVPLARQAMDALEEMRALTGNHRWVFPCGAAGRNRPLSEAAVLSALRRMGFTRDQTVAHSFRSTASTILNESGLWTPDAIEMQLAHAQKDRIRGIYNRAQRLEERRKMMQWYADKLDGLRLTMRKEKTALPMGAL